MPLIVRTACSGEVDELADLAARTFPLACPPELDPAVIDAFIAENLSPRAFHGYLTDADATVLSVRPGDGPPMGYALLVGGTTMDPSCAEQITLRPTVGVSKFYVDPPQHGSGVAAILLTEIERRAADQGARSLWLATNVGNSRARRFYARHGFEERGGRTFVVGGVPNSDVVYEKPLTVDEGGPRPSGNPGEPAAP